MKLTKNPRRWSIVATLGPASCSAEVLESMVAAGLSVGRLNFSHGTHEDHAKLVRTVREVAEHMGEPVAILQDLQGHKVRIGKVEGADTLVLKAGQEIRLGYGDSVTAERIGVDYEGLAKLLPVGSPVFLDDGRIELRVVAHRGEDLDCRVGVGGELRSRKGVIFPEVDLPFPLINDRDLEDARFGVSLGVDMIAMSFVRSGTEIEAMRRHLVEWGEPRPFLVAKVEDRLGIANLDDILNVCDAVLIARGDLGVTLPREKVPGIQKEVIRRANARGVAVITATEMLESMTQNDRPTRAEVTDVHNAVLDGTDAVMLSGETASGRYPILAVEEMDRICTAAVEDRLEHRTHRLVQGGEGLHAQVAEAAARMAETTHARCVVAFSLKGTTLRALSAARSPVPIYGVVTEERVRRQLQLHWGLSVVARPLEEDLSNLVGQVLTALKEQGICQSGDRVVVVAAAKDPDGSASPVLKIQVIR